MIVDRNFKTRQDLRDAVARGETIRVYPPPSAPEPPERWVWVVSGPRYPEPVRWHAEVEIEDDVIVKVR